MTSAYVEYRPLAAQQSAGVTHHVVIVNGVEVNRFNTQKEAAEWAKRQGYVVHVARERHLQDRDTPAHWRAY